MQTVIRTVLTSTDFCFTLFSDVICIGSKALIKDNHIYIFILPYPPPPQWHAQEGSTRGSSACP